MTPQRLAVVSGTSSGIGAAVADRLLERGYHVIGLSRRGNAELADRPGYLDRTVDLRDTGAVRDAVASVSDAAPHGVDAVVLNAGCSPEPAELTELSWDTVADSYAANVATALSVVQATGPLLAQAGGGTLTFVGASLANGYQPDRFAYAAAKAALTTLMRACSVEFADAGIVSNEVRPGPVTTAMTMPGLEGAVNEQILRVLNQGYAMDWLKSPRTVADWIVTIAEFPSNGPSGQVFNYSRRAL